MRFISLSRKQAIIAVSVAIVLTSAAIVTAALLIRQDVASSPSAVDPDVVFATGTDYASINTAGFATLTVDSSSASASLSLSGVSGAALTSLGDVLKITNNDATQAYDITLSRSAVPNGAISSFTVKVYNSGDTLIESWDAVATASGTQFNLPVSTTYDITIDVVVADGTTAGALGSFDIQFSLAPA